MMTPAAVAQQQNKVEAALTRYAQAAKKAGCPQDQLERFVAAGYVAQPHQLTWHAAARLADDPDGPSMIGIGGSRGPGKTHAAMGQVALDDCQRVEGLKFLFLRKVAKAGREAFDDLRRKLMMNTPHVYRQHLGVMEFANSSRIVLGHFHNENDIDAYLGIEYDGAVIEEATQLSRTKLQLLRGSIRTARPDWRPRLYLTTNPGGIGHQWFRNDFVLPWRAGTETETRFLPASANANKYLDEGYRAWLAGLDGTLGRMWRDGDWDVAGGAFFTSWSHDKHVVPAPETVPAHWRVWLAMDYGFQHYTVIYLFAQDDDGNVWILDEHAERQWLIEEHAGALARMLERNGIERHRISAFVAGHDCFAKRHDGGTIADQWLLHGWTLGQAMIDRISGAAEWLRRLGNPARNLAYIATTIRITQRCARLIETIPMLLCDPRRPEDVLKVDCDSEGNGGDDPYDGARYGLMVAANTRRPTLDFVEY